MLDRSLLTRRRPAAVAIGLALLVVLAAFAERGVHHWIARIGPAAGAEWIWTPAGTATVPRAFFAARDLALDGVPPEAELRIAADEEYVAWLNGRRVGSGVWSGHRLDVYPVAPLLETGGNRLVVEVRSARGAGGLLVALVAGEGEASEPLLVSDEAFAIFDRHEPGLVRGWLPLGDGAPAVSWGEAPTGRWGRLERGEPLPLFAAAAGPVARRRAVRPASLEPEPDAVVLGWEEPVVGYLTLELEPSFVGVGLLDEEWSAQIGPGPRGEDGGEDGTGGDGRAAGGRTARDEGVPIVTVPGAATWTDPLPRRFERVRVRGLDSIVGAHVHPVDPALLDRLAEPPAPIEGVFGIERPPPLHTPVERQVWRSGRE